MPILKKKEGSAGDGTSHNRKGSTVPMDSDYGERGGKHVTSNRATFKTAGRNLGFLNTNSPSLSQKARNADLPPSIYNNEANKLYLNAKNNTNPNRAASRAQSTKADHRLNQKHLLSNTAGLQQRGRENY